MARDIGEWLEERGLAKYVDLFVENEIDFAALSHIDEADLQELGLPMGPRKALLAAISELKTNEQSPAGAAAPAPHPDAERRQVTVLFADLANFTPLAERLGEEDTYRLIQRFSSEIADSVHRHGGTVQDFAGDGMMALFGAPAALEDAPLRACRAALEMQERMQGLERQLGAAHGERLQVRIGVHAGPLVIGEVGDDQSKRFTVVGDTVNLAARIETAAEPGSTYISAELHALVEGMVEADYLGERQLKGKSVPQRLYRLDGLKTGTSRFDAARDRGLTSLVEREPELEALRQCWQRALAGGIQLVDIAGEAGIGKSRLMHEFRERLPTDEAFVLEGDCYADGATSPFRPFVELVRTAFGLSAEQDRAAVAERLRSGLETLGLDVEHALPYLLALLGLDTGNPTFAAQGADLIGMRTRSVLLDLLWQRCRMTPVVMFVEDLHWIDSASEQLLQRALEADREVPLLVVCTFRPHYRPPWSSRDNVTDIALGPLTGDGMAQLLAERLATTELAGEVLRLVMEKAEGNPLFAEEIARYLQEKHRDDARGSPAIDDTVLPANVQNLVMDRVDRLGEGARSLLQTASVVGRKFASLLVRDVVRIDGFGRDMAEVERQEVVFPIRDPYADYAFKHALVRDAIYDTLMTSQKSAMHGAVAEALEQAYAGRVEEIAEILAHHFALSDRRDRAIRYLAMAGGKSLQLFSLHEADAYFARAVELFESGENEESGVNLAVILAGWSETLYWGAEFVRTAEIVHPRLSAVEALGIIPEVSWVLAWLGFAYFQMARMDEADRYLHRALEIAEACSDEEGVALSCVGLIQVHNFRPGDRPAEAVPPLAERALAFADKHDNLYLRTVCVMRQGANISMCGNCDTTSRMSLDLIELGRREGYGGAIAFGLLGVAYTQIMSERYEEAIRNADEGARSAAGTVDRLTCLGFKGMAMIFAGQVSPGLEVVYDVRRQITDNGYLSQLLVTELAIGIAKVLSGEIAAGVRWLETAVAAMSKAGNAWGAANGHLQLGQIYGRIAAGNDKPPLPVVLRNLIFLARTVPFAKAKSFRHFEAATRLGREFAMNGVEAQALMHIGLLHKAKGNLPEARRYLVDAAQVASKLDWQFLNDKIAAERAALE